MIRFYPLLTLLLVLLIPLTAISDELTTESLSRLREGVREHVLSNGLKIIFYKRDAAPVFAGIASVRVGGVNEELGKTGSSHLFEHMAFKGSTTIGTKDYSKEKVLLNEVEALHGKKADQGLTASEEEKLSALSQQLDELWDIQEFTRLYRRWGSNGLNATTAKELTNYFSNFPNTSFEFWCWAQSERLTNPVMRQFYKERDVVLEERRSRYENSPSGKLYERMLSHAFTIHPYRNPVIGYERDVRALQPDDVRELHEKYYVASNIVIGIVGDLEFEEILPTIEKYFSKIPSGPRPEQPTVVEPEQRGERKFTVYYEAEPIVMVGYKKPVYPDRDEPAISLFLEYILGSRVAPIYKKLVIEDRIASSLGYFDAPGDAFPNLAIIYGEPTTGHTNEDLVKEFDENLERVLREKISEKELKVLKRSILKAAISGMSSNMGLAREFASIEQKFGSWKEILNWYEELLAVSSDDVMRVGRKYFTRDRRTVGSLSREGDKNGGEG